MNTVVTVCLVSFFFTTFFLTMFLIQVHVHFKQDPYNISLFSIILLVCSNRILDDVEIQVQEVRGEMCLLYSVSTVQEWMDQHVTPVLEPLRNLLRDTESVLNEMGFCT